MAAVASTVKPIPAGTQARAPHPPSSRGTSTEAAIRDTARGSIVRPAWSGPAPDRSCR